MICDVGIAVTGPPLAAMRAVRLSASATARRTWTSAHGPTLASMAKKLTPGAEKDVGFWPDTDAKAFPSCGKATSIPPDRMARASLVSVEKYLTVMCWIGTLPPHQCGLADSSMPRVGSRLLISHGPVASISTPGLP